MTILQGNSASSGYAKGHLFSIRLDGPPPAYTIEDTDAESLSFQMAREKTIEQLYRLQAETQQNVCEEVSKIFEVHAMLLEDLDFIETVEGIIRDRNLNAQAAVYEAGRRFSELFSSMEDSYMKERAADILDVSSKLISVLKGDIGEHNFENPVIICAEELLPSQTLAWDKSKILGFVTAKGSYFSHAAILARTLGIPAICQIENYKTLTEGNYALLDGTNGTLIVEPSIECTCKFEEQCIEDTKHKELLRELIDKSTQTLDGTKVELCANIGSLCDMEAALSVGAEGIGLFRSEFIYMERSSFPTEEEQFAIYRKALEAAQGKRVIIRTLDLGADKHASYFEIPKEENPALGYRAIRICFDRPDIFNTQLRALLRASAYGKLGIMFPMITGLEQTRECVQRTRELADILRKEGHAVSEHIELGIMIETPAAALLSDMLAEEVDFFSIGTNDLTQYTLAADRMNTKVSYLYDPRHKAILRLIKLVTENAHRAGKWVGICGESAADPFLTAFYLSIGIDELSVSWSSLLSVKEKIRSLNLKDQMEQVRKLL